MHRQNREKALESQSQIGKRYLLLFAEFCCALVEQSKDLFTLFGGVLMGDVLLDRLDRAHAGNAATNQPKFGCIDALLQR